MIVLLEDEGSGVVPYGGGRYGWQAMDDDGGDLGASACQAYSSADSDTGAQGTDQDTSPPAPTIDDHR
jgi:hypothetical protein